MSILHLLVLEFVYGKDSVIDGGSSVDKLYMYRLCHWSHLILENVPSVPEGLRGSYPHPNRLRGL